MQNVLITAYTTSSNIHFVCDFYDDDSTATIVVAV